MSTYEWHTNDIGVHTSDIRMTTSTYQWYTDDIHEYIQVTYGWHTPTKLLILIQKIYDVINFKIYLQSSYKAMTEGRGGWGEVRNTKIWVSREQKELFKAFCWIKEKQRTQAWRYHRILRNTIVIKSRSKTITNN